MVIITDSAPPEEGILYHEPDCQILVDEVSGGVGHLYVTESNVVWINNENSTNFILSYQQISLHAVQRVPVPLIFIMLDYRFRLPGQQQFDNDDDSDGTPSTEVKFIPQNGTSLTPIYEALNTGQSLHPDENADDDDMAELEEFEYVVPAAQPNDAAAGMEGLSIEHSNGTTHAADDEEEDQFADA